jgi:hypothetical protein
MNTTKTKTTCVIIITTIFAAITTISTSLFPLDQIELVQNRNHDYHMAFAYHGKEILQKLSYAHFLPLTGNNQSNQVKVVVNYSVTEPSLINQKI